MRIAIIGAGLSGLTAARRLRAIAEVDVFDKARGPGGRLATRYADPYQFDHGAQFFTAHDPLFADFLTELEDAEVVARWYARFAEMEHKRIIATREWDDTYVHFVGAPKMNRLGRYLSEGVSLHLETRITSLRQEKGWMLKDENEQLYGPYDWVICTAPPEQAVELLPSDFAHHARVSATRMQGCFATMLGFAEPLPLPFDAALIKDADISWVSVNSSKPGRDTGFSLVVHATNKWADANLETPMDQVKAHLLAEISDVIGHDVHQADHCAIHRWRYANIERQEGDAALVDTNLRLAACGDWCVQGRVESAYLSGRAAASAIEEAA